MKFHHGSIQLLWNDRWNSHSPNSLEIHGYMIHRLAYPGKTRIEPTINWFDGLHERFSYSNRTHWEGYTDGWM